MRDTHLGHHCIHLSEKLLAFGLLWGGGELVIREAELLAAHQPTPWLAFTGPFSRGWIGFSRVSLGQTVGTIAPTQHTETGLRRPFFLDHTSCYYT